MFINKPVSRKSFLTGLIGLPLASLRSEKNYDEEEELRAQLNADPSVTSVIFLNMAGGMSQIDTLDPKKSSQFASVSSSLKGVELSETFRNTAKQLHLSALIRSVHSGAGDHERASYLLHTGTMPNAAFRDIPSFGAVIAFAQKTKGPWFPSHITLGGRGGLIGRGGLLGTRFDSFHISNVDKPLANLAPSGNMNSLRLVRRKEFLELTNRHFAQTVRSPSIENWSTLHNAAVDFMNSDKLAAFEYETADVADQKKYGASWMGKALLMARRLAEMQVPFIEITLGGWDTHSANKEKVAELAGLVDAPLAVLLSDLSARKMLDSTLVVMSSEFGRTPQMAANGNGRDHFPSAWTTLLAGGRLKKGIVYGATDDKGINVVNSPVTVGMQMATILSAAGIDISAELYNSEGRPFALAGGEKPVFELLQKNT